MTQPRTFSAAESSRLAGCSREFFKEILDNRWMRPTGAPEGGLTVRELSLIAAAKAFGIRKNDRRRFLVLHRNHPLLDGPAVIVLYSGESVEIVDAERFVFHQEVRGRVAIFDNRVILDAIQDPDTGLSQPHLF